MKTIGTVTAVLVMLVGLVTNTNGKQATLTDITAALDALKGEVGVLTKQIEELTKARAADQQTFSDSVRTQEDAAKQLISVERSANRTKQDLRAEQKALGSLKEGVDLGQSLLANLLTITLTIAALFIAIVSIFGGIIVSGLGKQQIEKTKGIFDKKVENVEEELHETNKEANLVTRALACLSPGIPRFEIQKSRDELELYLQSHPTARKVAIVLARLYVEALKQADSLEQAIAVLDLFLKAKADLRQFDNDYADVLYNRACYNVKSWIKTGDIKYKDRAYEDLTKAIEMSPANKADAPNDEDLKPLWEEARFRALTGEQKNTTLPS